MIRLQSFGVASAQPSLVVVPGIDGSIGSVEPLVERLARTREIFLVDYTQESEPTLEALSTAVAALLRDRMSASFDLMGQSIGTIIAAQAAAQNLPIRRVVLISTFLRLNDFKLRLSNMLTSSGPRWLYRLLSRPILEWSCGPVGDGHDHPFFAWSADSDPERIVKRTGWEIGRDFRTDIAHVPQPMLVLMGEKDRFVPNASGEIEALKKLLAGRDADVIAVPGAGHVLLPTPAIDFAVSRIAEFLR
jgi:pimeloyl-ACP methyl ester carboxylesterase